MTGDSIASARCKLHIDATVRGSPSTGLLVRRRLIACHIGAHSNGGTVRALRRLSQKKVQNRMQVIVRQIEGVTFVARGESNHWVAIDGPTDFNGSEAASRPMELLLMSLGGCTASDVASILHKKRARLDDLQLVVTGERAVEHPRIYSKIHVEYVFYGSRLKRADLERAIALSQDKYCPVTAMLRGSCELSHSYRVVE